MNRFILKSADRRTLLYCMSMGFYLICASALLAQDSANDGDRENKSKLDQKRVLERLGGSTVERSPGEARTGIFGLQAKGSKFVYVFDRSASMSGSPLMSSKKELIKSLDELGKIQQFYLIFYNQRLSVFTPSGARGRLIFANDSNKKSARTFIDSVRADGATQHAEAIGAAFRLLPDVVFVLTDADARDDLADEDVTRLFNQSRGAVVMVVQFSQESKPISPNLARLAKQCGGQYVSIETP